MSKIIKDYDQTFKELFDDYYSQKIKIYSRNARVKRTMLRFKKNLLDLDPRSRNKLKDYYKLKLAEFNTAPKIRSLDLIIFPFMLEKLIKVYNGKKYEIVKLTEESVGRYLGEFVVTRIVGKKPEVKGPKKPTKKA